MSVPISAITTSALRRSIPGIEQRTLIAASKGRSASAIASERRSICSSRKSRWARIAETTSACSDAKRPSSASRSCGSFARRLPLTLSDLRLAIAGQGPQRPLRLGRHETGPEQARRHQLAKPLRVRDVGLAARHLLDVAGVHEQALEPILED